jgi:hypothetical protein
MLNPKKVIDVEIAFGGDIGELLPSMDDIPDEFDLPGNTKWNKIISMWFFQGLPPETKFIPKDGIDSNDALRHIAAILRSFEPKHEHKESGCAYLMSLWFDDVIISVNK